MENKEQVGFDSGRGSYSNPIALPEVTVYGKKPIPWYKKAVNGIAKFFNDEILLNKDNVRVTNAQRYPEAMKAVKEGGDIAGVIATAPLAAYTAVSAAPAVMPILKVAGQAMTPSTWIGGLSQAAGYTTPTWLLNGADFLGSAYIANQAANDIEKNGLNWETGFNAITSLSPMTRETEAIEGVANAFKRSIKPVKSVVDDFRAARYAASSPRTTTIQQRVGYPLVSKGSWTAEPSSGLQFSNNTRNSEIDWSIPAIRTSEGLSLADGTLTPDLRGSLYNYFGIPSRTWTDAHIIAHPEWGDGFSIQRYSQNGRDYYIGENVNRSKIIYRLPNESDYNMIEPTSEQDYWRIRNEVENAILDSRYNFIESLPDNEIKSLVRSSNVNSKLKKSISAAVSPNNRFTNMLKGKVQNDIENVYLSDEYIDRYMRSLGLNPKSRDFREQIRSMLSNDIYTTYDNATPKVYVNNHNNGGTSTTISPKEHIYGINTNTDSYYLNNDWTSILFHEFGHNLWHDSTQFSEYLRKYNKRQIGNNFTPSDLTEVALRPENQAYAQYLQNPDEFRQRIMEGVRYGIKEGLTPEEIYNKCEICGFSVLKRYFKKDYLIKMLELMLGATPLLNNTNNDKTS